MVVVQRPFLVVANLDRGTLARESLRVKSQRFGVDDGDACGYRVPLGGVVEVPFSCARALNENL